ncbi:MAG: hemerythrin family protein [Campylobacterales bacterium]
MTDDLALGIDAMDETHADFVRQLEQTKADTRTAFVESFEALIAHTEAHFEMEEALMRTHGFYAMQEHFDEHEALLGEMRYFYDKARRVPAFGRAYIDEYAFEKFRRHVINIDSQLAMFLKSEAARKEKADV